MWGAAGAGTLGDPFDLGIVSLNSNTVANMRLTISVTNVYGLTITRTAGSTNFIAAGLASSITNGGSDEFTITYAAHGQFSTPESAAFTIDDSGEMQPLTFHVEATTVPEAGACAALLLTAVVVTRFR